MTPKNIRRPITIKPNEKLYATSLKTRFYTGIFLGLIVILSFPLFNISQNIKQNQMTATAAGIHNIKVAKTRSAMPLNSPVPIATKTKKPTSVPTSTKKTTLSPEPTEKSSCPSAPPQRVEVDKRGYVCTLYDRLIVHTEPGSGTTELTRIEPNTYFRIIDGPVCGNNWSWWRIKTDSGIKGWVAEGGDHIDPYFICPQNLQ